MTHLRGTEKVKCPWLRYMIEDFSKSWIYLWLIALFQRLLNVHNPAETYILDSSTLTPIHPHYNHHDTLISQPQRTIHQYHRHQHPHPQHPILQRHSIKIPQLVPPPTIPSKTLLQPTPNLARQTATSSRVSTDSACSRSRLRRRASVHEDIS